MFVPEKYEVTGQFRVLLEGELPDLYRSASFLNKAPRHEDAMGERRYSSTHSLTSALDGGEWSPSVLTKRNSLDYEKMRNVCTIMGRKPLGKWPLERRRR